MQYRCKSEHIKMLAGNKHIDTMYNNDEGLKTVMLYLYD